MISLVSFFVLFFFLRTWYCFIPNSERFETYKDFFQFHCFCFPSETYHLKSSNSSTILFGFLISWFYFLLFLSLLPYFGRFFFILEHRCNSCFKNPYVLISTPSHLGVSLYFVFVWGMSHVCLLLHILRNLGFSLRYCEWYLIRTLDSVMFL